MQNAWILEADLFALPSLGQCRWKWEQQLHNAHPGSCLTPHLPMSSLPPSPSFPCPAGQKDERQCAANTPISAVGLSQCHIPHHRISLERQSTQHCASQWLKAKLKTSLLIFWHHDNLLFWSTTNVASSLHCTQLHRSLWIGCWTPTCPSSEHSFFKLTEGKPWQRWKDCHLYYNH